MSVQRFRAAACEALARADTRCGPSRGEAAARCGFVEAANSEFKIQDSKLLLGLQPAEDACDVKTSRSSGLPRRGGCGPPTSLRSNIQHKTWTNAARRSLRCQVCRKTPRRQSAALQSRRPRCARTPRPPLLPLFIFRFLFFLLSLSPPCVSNRPKYSAAFCPT